LNETWLSDPRGYDHQFSLTANIDFCAKRLSVTAPDHPVGLGQRIRIPVVLTDDRIRFVWFVQSTYEGNGIGMPPIRDANGVFLEGSVGHTVNALRDGGESGKYIEVVPLALGNVEIAVVANFEDGGFDRRFFRMKVVPSSQGLESFQGYEPYPLTPPEDKEPEGRHATALMAQVTYKGIQDAIRLYSLQGVKFSIQQPPGPPVIEVDDKGQVRALRRGKATVEADFDGTKWSYPVHVSGESH
jgi:hypothetical protein